MPGDDVRIVLYDTEIAGLARATETRALVVQLGEQVAGTASAYAPHATGGGAASIRAEAVEDRGAWTAQVGWDQLHAYMFFADVGYRHAGARGRNHPGEHFLEHALDRYARL